MAVSGAVLREVGTTNITRLADYERAIGPNTGALMRVHTSNYRVSGFTKSVSLADLVALGKKHGVPVIDDVGSGALFDFARLGLPGEPLPRESIAAGADLTLFSGDKLLGGPQAGDHRRPQGVDTEDRKRPIHAGVPPRQDDAGRPGSDAAAVPERGAGRARGPGAAAAVDPAGGTAAAGGGAGGAAAGGAGPDGVGA